MPFTDTFRLSLLNHLFGGDPSPQPGSWWLGLSTTTPSSDGTNITEPPSGANYDRVEIVLGDAGWGNATGGVTASVANAGTVTFPGATSGWGTVTHFVLFQTQSTNTPVAFDALDPSIEVLNGTGLEFSAGELVFNAT